jgi:hypothetical protein
MGDTDTSRGQNDRRLEADIQERRTKALEQIATALGQIHHDPAARAGNKRQRHACA